MNCKFLFEMGMESTEFPEHVMLEYRTGICLSLFKI